MYFSYQEMTNWPKHELLKKPSKDKIIIVAQHSGLANNIEEKRAAKQ